MLIILAIDELAENRRLSWFDACVPTAESPTSTILYYPAMGGII